ncbi:MAG: GDP-mannose 4,6-dehydratase [Bacteroidetes bacterium]|nr:GDP-mannose 4,6-dehydratase [Bacteroidota bacterium]
MASYLITGCAGFIGSHLAEKLLEQGNNVLGIDNFDPFYDKKIKERNLSNALKTQNFTFRELDLKNALDLSKIDQHIDIVIHLAAKAGVLPSLKDPIAYINDNVLATQNLLNFCKEKEIRKFVFASSSSIYGNNKNIPFNESDTVDHPISTYAASKKACELLNYTAHHLYKLDVVNLRFFTVFGPRQRPDLAIHKFIKLIDEDKEIAMYGDGSTGRDYTFVSDTVQGIIGACNYISNHSSVYEIINLGNNQPVKLSTLIQTIEKVMNKKAKIKQMPMQPGDVDITFANIEKAKNLFAYAPSTSLEEGISHFVKWYNEQKA